MWDLSLCTLSESESEASLCRVYPATPKIFKNDSCLISAVFKITTSFSLLNFDDLKEIYLSLDFSIHLRFIANPVANQLVVY